MSQAHLISQAQSGDRAAFDALVTPELPRLRAVVRRFVGDRGETDDVVQDALIRAFDKLDSLREPDRFRGWLTAVASRCALDHLRGQKRWRPQAQLESAEHFHDGGEREAQLYGFLQSPEHTFDAAEHISFCFTCLGRSLDPEHQGTLVLRDMLDYSNREASKMMGLSESVFRHKLREARTAMQKQFEGMCAIVKQDGACYQCTGLRENTHEARRGPEIPDLAGADAEQRYQSRLRVIQNANTDDGKMQKFHDMVWGALRSSAERADEAQAAG